MDNKIKRVAIYCRVSTIEQAEEGYSIKEQEMLLMEFCEKQGYEVVQVYSDAGISGKDITHLTDEMMQFFNFNVGETPTKGVSPNLFKDYKINTFDLEMVI